MEPLPELEDAFQKRYQPVRTLGRGGIGLVIEATDASTGRPVAIKFLTGQLTDEVRERFFREGRQMAQIEHPHVARVFDMAVLQGQPYIVMELLTGGSLRDRIAKGPLPIKEATRILGECLEGLAACHALKLVHRDLKPENIMFAADGAARITDLGVALNDEEAARLTKTGAFIGTPAYAAPEMFEEREAGQASDVYAMGLIFYEMLAGKPIGDLSSLGALIGQRLNGKVPDPAALGVAVPLWAWTLIQKTLARKPEDRPQDASEMVAAMREALASSSQRLKRSGPVSRAKPASRPDGPVVERPFTIAPAWVAAGALLAVLAGGAIALAALRPPKKVEAVALCHELVVTASRTRARVAWKTRAPAAARLAVWAADDGEAGARAVPETPGPPGFAHELDVTGLDPKKSYRFRIDGEPAESVATIEPVRGLPSLTPDYSQSMPRENPLLAALCDVPYKVAPRLTRQRYPPGERLLAKLTDEERAKIVAEQRSVARAHFRPVPSMDLERWLAAVPYWLGDPGFEPAERARIYAMAAELTSADSLALHTAGEPLFGVQERLSMYMNVRWGAPRPEGADLTRSAAFAPALKAFPDWMTVCEQRGPELGEVFATVVPWKDGDVFFGKMREVIHAVVKAPPEARIPLWHALGDRPPGETIKVWLQVADLDPNTRLWLRFGGRARVPIAVPRIDPKAPKMLEYMKPPEFLDRMARSVAVTLPAGFVSDADRSVELAGEFLIGQVKPRDSSTKFFWLHHVVIGR